MGDLVIGLDIGTSACKAVAVDGDGRVVARSRPQAYSDGNDAEAGDARVQDVAAVGDAADAALREVLRSVGGDAVVAVALSGAMHSVLPVTEDGQPLAPASTWRDDRPFSLEASVRGQVDYQALYRRTGCPCRWLYHPVKLRWLAAAHADVFKRAARLVAIKDWVLHRLTGVWATDTSLASTTGLLDIRTQQWDAEALRVAGVDEIRLPALVQPDAVVGEVTESAAHATGLRAGTQVVAGGSDGALANVGAGCGRLGGVVVTLGTSGAMRVTVDQPRLDAKQRTWCYVLSPTRWVAGGAINNGGGAVEWLRRKHYGDVPANEGYAQLMADAASVPPGADGVIVLPYFAGERSPHWRPNLTAVIDGFESRHHRGHLARAVLEGVAFCLLDVWRALFEGDTVDHPVRLTGGALTRSPLWAQIVTDVLGVPCVLTESADASAVGAAAVGLGAVGRLGSLDDFGPAQTNQMCLSPDADRHARYMEGFATFQSLATAALERLGTR